MSITSSPIPHPATASGAISRNERIDASGDTPETVTWAIVEFAPTLNGAFGEHLVEEPINFEAALDRYPSTAPLIEDADWQAGGTPFGV